MADNDDLLDYEDEEQTDQVVAEAGDQKKDVKGTYVSIHSSGFRDFLLKPEILRAIVDCGFEHPSAGENLLGLWNDMGKFQKWWNYSTDWHSWVNISKNVSIWTFFLSTWWNLFRINRNLIGYWSISFFFSFSSTRMHSTSCSGHGHSLPSEEWYGQDSCLCACHFTATRTHG